jgi:hypothetical protein
VRKESKIFEKAEIRWVCVDELKRMRSKFRCFFQNIVDDMYTQRENIHSFVQRGLGKGNKRTRKNYDSRV